MKRDSAIATLSVVAAVVLTVSLTTAPLQGQLWSWWPSWGGSSSSTMSTMTTPTAPSQSSSSTGAPETNPPVVPAPPGSTACPDPLACRPDTFGILATCGAAQYVCCDNPTDGVVNYGQWMAGTTCPAPAAPVAPTPPPSSEATCGPDWIDQYACDATNDGTFSGCSQADGTLYNWACCDGSWFEGMTSCPGTSSTPTCDENYHMLFPCGPDDQGETLGCTTPTSVHAWTCCDGSWTTAMSCGSPSSAGMGAVGGNGGTGASSLPLCDENACRCGGLPDENPIIISCQNLGTFAQCDTDGAEAECDAGSDTAVYQCCGGSWHPDQTGYVCCGGSWRTQEDCASNNPFAP